VITKAVYENGVLRPLKKLNLQQGEEVEIEIKDAVLRTKGIIKLDPEIAREIADSDELSALEG
jgi:predicted DNA-binding antitoxin AbrB/MazE fold protein